MKYILVGLVILFCGAILFPMFSHAQEKGKKKAETLLTSALAIRDKIIRGDERIGILPKSEKQKMRDLLLKAGKKGSSQAWFELGMAYYLGWFSDDKNSNNKTAQYFKQAGQSGYGLDAWKMLIKTSYFRRPESIQPNEIKAIIEQHITQDDTGEMALFKGYMLYKGYGYEKNEIQAKDALFVSANLGNADAMFELYIFYRMGYGGATDPEQAIGWCMKAAKKDQTRAMYNVATMHAKGYGHIEKDIDEAILWYTEASEKGHGKSGETLSIMYALGVETPKDMEKAKYFFQQSFENGGYPEVLYEDFDLEVPSDW